MREQLVLRKGEDFGCNDQNWGVTDKQGYLDAVSGRFHTSLGN